MNTRKTRMNCNLQWEMNEGLKEEEEDDLLRYIKEKLLFSKIVINKIH